MKGSELRDTEAITDATLFVCLTRNDASEQKFAAGHILEKRRSAELMKAAKESARWAVVSCAIAVGAAAAAWMAIIVSKAR